MLSYSYDQGLTTHNENVLQGIITIMTKTGNKLFVFTCKPQKTSSWKRHAVDDLWFIHNNQGHIFFTYFLHFL